MSINWVIPFKTRLNWDIPVYPRLSFSPVQGYPVISHLVPSYPLERYPRISQDISRQDSCLGISHYKFSVLGYPGLSRDKHHIGLSRDIPDIPCGRFSRCYKVVILCYMHDYTVQFQLILHSIVKYCMVLYNIVLLV